MRSRLPIGAMLLVLPILQTPTARRVPLTAAECKCSIEITAKRQGNGEPLGDVGIVATFVPAAQNPVVDGTPRPAAPATLVTLTATTDNSGHATFPNLAEGTYSIRAQREGFFGPLVNGNASTTVFATATVGAAPNPDDGLTNYLAANAAARSGLDPATAGNLLPQPVQHVSIAMIPGSVISGRIQDANHRPVSGVAVAALQAVYQNGQRTLRQTVNQVQTDDLGQFRLYWFAPGEYYLRITLPPVQAARGGVPNFPSPTYYPGTLDPKRATAVVVREGEESNGADFALESGKGVNITGTVINTLPGRVGPQGQVNHAIGSYFLVAHNPEFIEPPQPIPSASASVGRRGAAAQEETSFPFEIRGVPPGTYDFYPIFNDGASPRSNYFTGHLSIEVGTENIAGIQSVIQPGVDLKVHLSVTGTPPVTPANRPVQPVSLQNMRLQIRPVDNLPAQLAIGVNLVPTPDNDGISILTNLPEARFVATSIQGIPADAYVSEMRQGSRSIMNDGVITIGKETPDPLEVVISRRGGTISGTVQDSQHKPVSGGRVVLIPDSPRRRNLLLYKIFNANAMGVFNVSGIAPGAYKLFALDNIPQGAEQNEEFVSRYEVLGTRVIVDAGTPLTNIQVSLIQANR